VVEIASRSMQEPRAVVETLIDDKGDLVSTGKRDNKMEDKMEATLIADIKLTSLYSRSMHHCATVLIGRAEECRIHLSDRSIWFHEWQDGSCASKRTLYIDRSIVRQLVN